MKLSLITKKQLRRQPLELLIVPSFQDQDQAKLLKEYLGTADLVKQVGNDFKPKLLSTLLVYTSLSHQRVLLVGLGLKKDFDISCWRRAVQTAIIQAGGLEGVKRAGLMLPNEARALLEVTAFALTFGQYKFEQYKHPEEPSARSLEQIYVISQVTAKTKQALNSGQLIAEACNHARDLGNHPGNIATPTLLANHALKLARQYKFKCRVLDERQIKKEGLDLLMGVGQGSKQPSRFVILEYGNVKRSPITLIGKGLTFDSGGISIKPGERMEEMKYDMSGAATVLSIFEAAAALKLPLNLVGLIPSAENLPSGSSIKPGDVLTAYSGKTVEIINTDAEGRLILADAISFAKKHYQPKLLIDYATLTGAIVVALGDQLAGCFSNSTSFDSKFIAAAASSGENLWIMPLAKEEYKEQLASTVADVKNMGERRSADATTAALFLEYFVGSTPWVHLDIAGTAWTTKPRPYMPLGATGWGVYLSLNFLRSLLLSKH